MLFQLIGYLPLQCRPSLLNRHTLGKSNSSVHRKRPGSLSEIFLLVHSVFFDAGLRGRSGPCKWTSDAVGGELHFTSS